MYHFIFRFGERMDLFLRIDINIVAMVLLGIIAFIAYQRLDRRELLNQIFLLTSLVVGFELLVESLTCIMNERPELWARNLSQGLHVCSFGIAPILTYLWYCIVGYWIYPDQTLVCKRNMVLLLPVLLNGILTILSMGYGFIFFIDEHNVYHRGFLFPLSCGIIYFYLALAFILIIKNKRKIPREEYIPFIIFGIMPLIGGMLQALFYGILLMWSSAAFSLLVVYIFLQQRMIQLDYLTGAWSRATFENCLKQRMRQKHQEIFGLVCVDMDGLKAINDRYGHFEGDYALSTAVRLIKSVLQKTDIIARAGGDEFYIILDCDSWEKMNETVSKISQALAKFNQESDKGYQLDCSVGCGLFHSDQGEVKDFIRKVDLLMYENKRMKKGI